MNRQALSRLYLIAALAVLLALVLPLLALAPCAVPAGDDYSYGTETHRAWRETGSVPAAVAAAGRTVAQTWHGWQGTFSAVFLMALQPAVFAERLYAITPYLMLTALFAGVSSLCLVGVLQGISARTQAALHPVKPKGRGTKPASRRKEVRR